MSKQEAVSELSPSAGPWLIEAMPDQAERYDVIVVGAGASGIPAAIAAARQGAHVLLLEEDALPGGAPVDNYVTLLCGGPKVGIFLEMCNRLNARHDLTGRPQKPFPDVGRAGCEAHWYLPSAYVQVLQEMMSAETNLTVRCGSRVAGVVVAPHGARERVLGVAVDGPVGSGRRFYAASVTIDATGTGAVAAMAGCQTAYGRDARGQYNEALAPQEADSVVQPCTWMYISQRIRPGAVLPERKLIPGGFVEPNIGWVNVGDPPVGPESIGAYLHWGATVTCDDTRDEQALGRASGQAVEQLGAVMALLEEAGFVMHLAPRLGVREVRRVMGEYVVTAGDLKSGRMFDDTIAYNEFMLDVWGAGLDEGQRRLPRGAIPYRALVPRGTEGLLIAGKAISGSHLAMGSYRVQPIVASIGTAAGIAAALAAAKQTGLRDIPVSDLQQRLRVMGVIE